MALFTIKCQIEENDELTVDPSVTGEKLIFGVRSKSSNVFASECDVQSLVDYCQNWLQERAEDKLLASTGCESIYMDRAVSRSAANVLMKWAEGENE